MRAVGVTGAILALYLGFLGLLSEAAAQTPSEPKAIAEGFLNKLYGGDLGSLYDSALSKRAKAFVQRDSFIQGVNVWRIQAGSPAQSRLFIGGTPVSQLQNGQTGDFYYIRFREGYASGQVFTDVTLEKEEGNWLVYGYWFSPAPPQ